MATEPIPLNPFGEEHELSNELLRTLLLSQDPKHILDTVITELHNNPQYPRDKNIRVIDPKGDICVIYFGYELGYKLVEASTFEYLVLKNALTRIERVYQELDISNELKEWVKENILAEEDA